MDRTQIEQARNLAAETLAGTHPPPPARDLAALAPNTPPRSTRPRDDPGHWRGTGSRSGDARRPHPSDAAIRGRDTPGKLVSVPMALHRQTIADNVLPHHSYRTLSNRKREFCQRHQHSVSLADQSAAFDRLRYKC